MSKKKAKTSFISSLLQHDVPAFAAAYFRIGCVPLKADGQPCLGPDGNPVFPKVISIKHCRDRFGSGTIINQPCYVVSFEDSLEQTIIPTTCFTQATVVVEDGDDEESVPGLPQ